MTGAAVRATEGDSDCNTTPGLVTANTPRPFGDVACARPASPASAPEHTTGHSVADTV